MKIKVEQYTNRRTLYFQLKWGDGHWQNVPGETWNRKMASHVLDILERVYDLNRRLVRFEHR